MKKQIFFIIFFAAFCVTASETLYEEQFSVFDKLKLAEPHTQAINSPLLDNFFGLPNRAELICRYAMQRKNVLPIQNTAKNIHDKQLNDYTGELLSFSLDNGMFIFIHYLASQEVFNYAISSVLGNPSRYNIKSDDAGYIHLAKKVINLGDFDNHYLSQDVFSVSYLENILMFYYFKMINTSGKYLLVDDFSRNEIEKIALNIPPEKDELRFGYEILQQIYLNVTERNNFQPTLDLVHGNSEKINFIIDKLCDINNLLSIFKSSISRFDINEFNGAKQLLSGKDKFIQKIVENIVNNKFMSIVNDDIEEKDLEDCTRRDSNNVLILFINNLKLDLKNINAEKLPKIYQILVKQNVEREFVSIFTQALAKGSLDNFKIFIREKSNNDDLKKRLSPFIDSHDEYENENIEYNTVEAFFKFKYSSQKFNSLINGKLIVQRAELTDMQSTIQQLNAQWENLLLPYLGEQQNLVELYSRVRIHGIFKNQL